MDFGVSYVSTGEGKTPTIVLGYRPTCVFMIGSKQGYVYNEAFDGGVYFPPYMTAYTMADYISIKDDGFVLYFPGWDYIYWFASNVPLHITDYADRGITN